MPAHCRRYCFVAHILALVCSATLAASAFAATVLQPGTPLIVQVDGPVTAQFVGGESALFNNELFLQAPANALGMIFQNNTSPLGQIEDLGSFTAGTELIFRMHVVETNFDYFSGPGSRNPDAPLPHSRVVS